MTSPRPRLVWSITGAFVLLLIGVGLAATRVSGLQGSVPDRVSTFTGPAPEFTGIDAWLNTDEPITIAGSRGRVVLVDFWTYTCVNCVRTFPHLRAFHDAYHEHGLEIVGIHSPEFSFEKDESNVRAAIARHDLPYPVALDNDMQTWRAYRNRWWPHVYLIDAEGQIRFDHIGEGGEEKIQDRIRSLLLEAGAHDLPSRVTFDGAGPGAHITPEVYLGTQRGIPGGYLGNDGGYRDGRADYGRVDPPAVEAAPTSGRFWLEGPWVAQEESLRAAGRGARIILPFFASDAFFVARGDGSVRVLLDGSPVPARAAGEDVRDGLIAVDRDDLFAAVRMDEPGRHILTLEVAPGVEVFTFTFG